MPPPNPQHDRRNALESERRRQARRSAAERMKEQSQPLSGAVSFQLRRLEPIVGWALAAYTFWASLVLTNADGAQWLMVVFAAAMALWARQYPARIQLPLFVRAVLFLIGAQFIGMAPGSGGPMGAYFVWPCVVVVFYGLLLVRSWALCLSGLALLGYAIAAWFLRSEATWPAMANHFAFLAALAGLSAAFGETLRISGEKAESTLRDDRSHLYNETGLFVHGAQLLEESRRRGQAFCMVLLHGTDLKDISSLVGRKVANDLFMQMVKVIGMVPGNGIAARIEGAEFVLLMPGLDNKTAQAYLHQRLGNPPKVEVRIKGKAVAIVLEMVAGQADTSDHELDTLYDSLHRQLQQQSRSEGNPTLAGLLDIEIGEAPSHRRAAAPTVPMELQSTPVSKRRS